MQDTIEALENRVNELENQVRVSDILEAAEVVRVQAPYEDGTQSNSDGVIPVIVNGIRYNILVNEV